MIVLFIAFSCLVLMFMLGFWLIAPIKEAHSIAQQMEHESEQTFYVNDKTRSAFPSVTDTPSKYISLIVPAYNEEERLPIMLKEAIMYLKKRAKVDGNFTYEIIIVDDGSTDSTSKIVLEEVRKLGSDTIRLLKLHKNRGKGGAIKMGILRARGRFMLMVDADAATDISDLSRLEKEMLKIEQENSSGKEIIIVGSRAHLQDDAIATRAWYRNILMHGFHLIVDFLCVRGIRDTQCGFKLFNRIAVHRIFPSLHIQRWAFDVEILFIAQQVDAVISEIAVNWHEVDGSKLNIIDATLTMLRDMVMIRLLYMVGLWRVHQSKHIVADITSKKKN